MSKEAIIDSKANAPEGFRGAGAAALPAAWLYGVATGLRNRLYDWGLRTTYAPKVFTISVGGIEAGGVGKSPVTQALLNRLLELGRQPALVSRGYGRSAQGLYLRRKGEPAEAAQMGDEPAMMVASGLDIPVGICPKRKLAVSALERLGECDSVVLDDGFAHRALKRHLDVVVLRAEAPFGDGYLLPAGTLRESPSALARADVLWFHAKRGETNVEAMREACAFSPQAKVIESEGTVVAARNGLGECCELEGLRVVAVAGIARPADLAFTLERSSVDVAEFMAFPDHHAFTEKDVSAMRSACARHDATGILVTAKDRVKLAPFWSDDPAKWFCLDYGVRITSGQEELDGLLGQVV